MWRTVRFRTTVAATIASAALLVVVSIVTVLLLRAQLTDNLDEGLIGRADEIAMLLAADPAPELPRNEDVLIQVLASDGTVRQASASVQGMAPITSAHVGVRTVDDVPGRPEQFRVVVRTVDTPRGPATLLVGVNDDDVSDPVRILSRVLAGAVPLVVASLAALTWWLTGRTLRPVERMRRELAEITAGHRGRRVAEPGTADEVDRLARTMNETLDRLDAAITRQTRFVADASHELRSPLTRIRTELEVDLVTPGSREEIERSVLQDVVSLQHLVDDLLQLARSDEGVAALRLERVDLDDIVLKEARRAVERGRVDVDVSAVAAAQTIGDPRHLTRVVRNLLDNAERHARRTVTLSLDEDTTATRLVVVDDGAGIPSGDREHIFERFARADQARSRDAGGSGLGLAIARDIVERHGGEMAEAAAGRRPGNEPGRRGRTARRCALGHPTGCRRRRRRRRAGSPCVFVQRQGHGVAGVALGVVEQVADHAGEVAGVADRLGGRHRAHVESTPTPLDGTARLLGAMSSRSTRSSRSAATPSSLRASWSRSSTRCWSDRTSCQHAALDLLTGLPGVTRSSLDSGSQIRGSGLRSSCDALATERVWRVIAASEHCNISSFIVRGGRWTKRRCLARPPSGRGGRR